MILKRISFCNVKALLILALFNASNHTQAALFAGYDEFCGIATIIQPTNQIAVATMREGVPYIIIDPSAASNITNSRRFALAHECGHHFLGHVSLNGKRNGGESPKNIQRQELEADCWAAQQLSVMGYYDDLQRGINRQAFDRKINYPYPDGLTRAKVIQYCASSSYSGDESGVFIRSKKKRPKNFKCKITREFTPNPKLSPDAAEPVRTLLSQYHRAYYELKVNWPDDPDPDYDYCGEVKLIASQKSECELEVTIEQKKSSTQYRKDSFTYRYDFSMGIEWTRDAYFDEERWQRDVDAGGIKDTSLLSPQRYFYSRSKEDYVKISGDGFFLDNNGRWINTDYEFSSPQIGLEATYLRIALIKLRNMCNKSRTKALRPGGVMLELQPYNP